MTDDAVPGVRGVERDWLELAEVYALDAVSDTERARIEARLVTAGPAEKSEFESRVRDARETMADVAAATAVEPPEQLRGRVLDAIADRPDASPNPAPVDLDARRAARRHRLRNGLLAAAAAVVVAVGGVAVGSRMWSSEPAPTAEQVFAADDVRTSSGSIEGGGTATVVYSKDVDAGVLVMNNVAPPAEGTVYQMWLMNDQGSAQPAGTMDAGAVAPSTTAVLEGIGDATALGFTVEPPGGSTQPTGQIFAELPLT
ncbi:anti-sigma factor [Rhodococcus sp. NPDC003348]